MEADKKKEIVKNIIKILVLLVVILAVDRIIGFYIEPVKYSDYFKHDPVYKKAKEEGCDLIFMGGSHMEMCMNPRIFEEKMGFRNVLNVSATDQPIKGLYYYLLELNNEVKPKYVVVDITNQNLFGKTYYQGQINLMDKMSFPYNAMYYFSDEELIKASPYLLRTYKYKDFFFQNVRTRKADVAALGYQEGEGYEYGGFERTLPLYEKGGVPIVNYLGDDSSPEMKDESLKYLLKIKKYCDKKGIALYTVSCPISLMAIYNTQDYEERLNRYKKWASDNGITYHNLSYLRNREEIVSDDMWDPGHVAGTAGDRVSEVYADILKADIEGSGTDDYFYSNLSELREDVKRVVAVDGKFSIAEGIVTVNMESIQGDNLAPLYRVTLLELGKETIVSDWTKDTQISFEPGYIAADTCVIIEAMTESGLEEIPAKQVYFLANVL